MSVKISVSKDQIDEFCRRHRIRRLAFFGSVVRDDFSPDSDVDVLVEFEHGYGVGMITLAGLEIELSQILGRRAEIHTYKGLNPLFRDRVIGEAEVFYDAA
jgi:predicted nucleotidyltransferase